MLAVEARTLRNKLTADDTDNSDESGKIRAIRVIRG
jgi:hypothetical protein